MGEALREPVDGELARRIRSLEAERLRPVPPPPPLTGDLRAITTTKRGRRAPQPEDPAIKALRRAGDLYRAKNAAKEGDS